MSAAVHRREWRTWQARALQSGSKSMWAPERSMPVTTSAPTGSHDTVHLTVCDLCLRGAGPCGHILFDEYTREEEQAIAISQEEQAAVLAKTESATPLTALGNEAEATRRQAGARGNEEALFARVQ